MSDYNRGVLSLKDLCLFTVNNNLNPSNVYPFYLETLRTYCPRMERVVNSFICDNFMDISRTEQFLALDSSAINWMLINHDIRASEAAMLDSLARWYKHNEAEREKDFKWLFQRLSLDMIGKDVLSEIIKKYQLVNVIPELRKYKKLLPQRVDLDELIYKENISNIAVLGYIKHLTTEEPLKLYNFTLQYWAPFTSKSMIPKCAIEGEIFEDYLIDGIIPIHNSVYFVYSRIDLTRKTTSLQLMRVDIQSQSTTECAISDGLHYEAIAVPCGIFIYFLGGRDGEAPPKTVYRYDTVKNNWSEMQSMISDHSSVYDCVVSYKNKYLYIFGKTFSEKYDMMTNTWTPLVPPWDGGIALPEGAGQGEVIWCMSAECLDDRICVLLLIKSSSGLLSRLLVFYDPVNSAWEFHKIEGRLHSALKKCFGNNFVLYYKKPRRFTWKKPGNLSIFAVEDSFRNEKKLFSTKIGKNCKREYKNIVILSRRARTVIEKADKPVS